MKFIASKHLIIGGTTKSGTTSLFNYLGDHSEVCSSSMKETRFFLDKEYPLSSKYRYEDGAEKYFEFFKHHLSEKILMEATPDYLYSKNTPKKIKKSLPDAKLIFILREPRERFISWFNFSKQIGKIDSSETLQRFIEMQSMQRECSEQHLMALQQGIYSKYLKEYYECFSKNDIHICFIEDLVSAPLQFMKAIANFINIDAEFYEDYSFEKHNATVQIKNQGLHSKYIEISFAIRKFTHNKKMIHGILKGLKIIFYPIYEKLNSQKSESVDINEKAYKQIDKYYQAERRLYEEKYKEFFTEYEVRS